MRLTDVPVEPLPRVRHRIEERKRLGSLGFVAGLHVFYGFAALTLLVIYVGVWATQGKGAFATAMGKTGYSPELGALVFFVWISIAVLHICAGRALQAKLPRGRWLASLASVLMLSSGLYEVANASADFMDALLFIGFPLLSLFVVNARVAGPAHEPPTG